MDKALLLMVGMIEDIAKQIHDLEMRLDSPTYGTEIEDPED